MMKIDVEMFIISFFTRIWSYLHVNLRFTNIKLNIIITYYHVDGGSGEDDDDSNR